MYIYIGVGRRMVRVLIMVMYWSMKCVGEFIFSLENIIINSIFVIRIIKYKIGVMYLKIGKEILVL